MICMAWACIPFELALALEFECSIMKIPAPSHLFRMPFSRKMASPCMSISNSRPTCARTFSSESYKSRLSPLFTLKNQRNAEAPIWLLGAPARALRRLYGFSVLRHASRCILQWRALLLLCEVVEDPLQGLFFRLDIQVACIIDHLHHRHIFTFSFEFFDCRTTGHPPPGRHYCTVLYSSTVL